MNRAERQPTDVEREHLVRARRELWRFLVRLRVDGLGLSLDTYRRELRRVARRHFVVAP